MRGVIGGLCLVAFALHGFGDKTLFGTRSQALNAARELAGWQRHTHLPDQDSCYATFSIVPEYNHSFRANKIACFLFGSEKLVFSGSQVADREPCEILADYFGLPSDFLSNVCFDPLITSFIMDFDWYIGLDGIAPGLYTRIHLPVVHTKWDVKLCECVIDPGTTFTSYPAGYFSDSAIELTQLTQGDTAPKNVQQAFQGKAVFGDMREPLKYGKIFGRQNEVRVAELWLVLGYDFIQKDWAHFGLNIRAAAPTGNLRKSEFLFEPIAGNDHHWELGGGLTFHYDFCDNQEEQKKFGFYVDANITHMFGSTQKRSFDLCTTTTVGNGGGNGSRYMLLQEIASPSIDLHVGLSPNNELAANQYRRRLVPAINITTLDAKIDIDVQADIVAKFYYQRRGFEFDLGYNFWGRSEEKLDCRECIPECFAFKGDAQVYGFTVISENAIPLNATQHGATINGGQDISDDGEFAQKGNFATGKEWANFNADNVENASDNLGNALQNLKAADALTFNVSQQNVFTSNPAILLTNDDINECSALLPKAISHKLFTYFGYTYERPGTVPYIGVGAFVEWACICVCNNSAPSQWGVWLKGGVSFR